MFCQLLFVYNIIALCRSQPLCKFHTTTTVSVVVDRGVRCEYMYWTGGTLMMRLFDTLAVSNTYMKRLWLSFTRDLGFCCVVNVVVGFVLLRDLLQCQHKRRLIDGRRLRSLFCDGGVVPVCWWVRCMQDC